jgi:hypothetical protein
MIADSKNKALYGVPRNMSKELAVSVFRIYTLHSAEHKSLASYRL